jgi:iron complex outermembrane recepter protein
MWRITNSPTAFRSKQSGATLREEFDLGWSKLLGVTAYRHFRGFVTDDTDATNVNLFAASAEFLSDQFSQELQLLSPDSSPITWIAGLYYLHETSGDDPLTFAGNNLTFPTLGSVVSDFRVKLDSYAVFGQATAPLDFILKDLKLTLGGRYTG